MATKTAQRNLTAGLYLRLFLSGQKSPINDLTWHSASCKYFAKNYTKRHAPKQLETWTGNKDVCVCASPTINKKFELMLTRRAKAYSSSGSVVTHRSTNRVRRRVTSFQSKRVTNYATPPTRHLMNDIDLRSPKSLKSLSPPAPGSMNLSRLRLLKSTFNAENFIRRLSWSNSSHFVTIQY